VAVDDILDVAVELFGSRGIRGTSIAAIADRSGLTDAGILHYFPTKTKLIGAALDRAAQRQVAQMIALVQPGGLEAIRGLGEWGAVVESDPSLAAFSIVLSTEGLFEDSVVRDWEQRRYESIRGLGIALVQEGIARGEIRPDADPELEASAMIAFLDGIRLQWFYTDRTLPLARTVRRYFDQIVERLAAEVPPANP
jgi:AcrR family transcriptional regulator